MHSELRNLLCRRRLVRRSCLAAIVTLLCFAMTGFAAENGSNREYEIKAAYLYNFIHYVDWPTNAFPPGDTITIGVAGDNPFGPALDPLNGKMIKGRKLAVKKVTTAAERKACQILFISPSERARLPELLAELKDAKVLTVSETEGFAERGGIINFVEERNRIRFEINPEAARRTGFTISSELLKLARIVRS
jgi:hypothetical protein